MHSRLVASNSQSCSFALASKDCASIACVPFAAWTPRSIIWNIRINKLAREHPGRLTEAAASTDISPESQTPLIFPSAGMTPSANDPSCSAASASPLA